MHFFPFLCPAYVLYNPFLSVQASKALSVGVRLLASRRVTVAAAATAAAVDADRVAIGDVPDSGAASTTKGDDRRGKAGGPRKQQRRTKPVSKDKEGVGRNDADGGKEEGGCEREEREEELARDVFAAADALREAFDSALSGSGAG